MLQISIILATYGKAIFISEAIKSVINQTFRDWELLIISDPPIDKKSEEIIIHYSQINSRVKYFKNEIKLGFRKSLNQGLKRAQGKYIARIDDDDIWVQKKIK